jgi:VWFA-related protein
MNTLIRLALLCVGGVWALVPQTVPQVVRSTIPAVLLDVTVLDRQGKPVSDLKAQDFEVKEDGKPQQLTMVSLIQNGVASALSKATASMYSIDSASVGESSPMHAAAGNGITPTVTAILLDNLSAETRPLACRAVQLFIEGLQPPHEYAGIFAGGLGFSPLQLFTNSIEELRKGVKVAAARPSDNFSVNAERSRTTPRTQGLDPATPVTAGAEYAAGWTTIGEREARLNGKGGGGDPSEALFTQMELRMQEGYSRFLATYAGDSSLASLRSTVHGLSALTGRKLILYFTDELPITDRLKSRFNDLIGEANRANIVIYTIDAVGLRVHSKESETARVINLGGAQGVGDARRNNGAWTKDMEDQSAALSSRPGAALGRLAGETGGRMIDNTNDLASGLSSIQTERRFYYLLGYQPSNTTDDGRFRHIKVTVKRDKAVVKTRSGYFAPGANK